MRLTDTRGQILFRYDDQHVLQIFYLQCHFWFCDVAWCCFSSPFVSSREMSLWCENAETLDAIQLIEVSAREVVAALVTRST